MAKPRKDKRSGKEHSAATTSDAGQFVQGDSYLSDRKANSIHANAPANISDWGGERLRDDKRWQHGLMPEGNVASAEESIA